MCVCTVVRSRSAAWLTGRGPKTNLHVDTMITKRDLKKLGWILSFVLRNYIKYCHVVTVFLAKTHFLKYSHSQSSKRKCITAHSSSQRSKVNPNPSMSKPSSLSSQTSHKSYQIDVRYRIAIPPWWDPFKTLLWRPVTAVSNDNPNPIHDDLYMMTLTLYMMTLTLMTFTWWL